MKRFVCILLSLMLCLSAFSALAETAAEQKTDYSGDEVGLEIKETELPKVELKQESQAVSKEDTVVKQENVYSIKTPSRLNISLNAAGLPSFIVLTQSYYASLDIYSRFNSDSEATNYISDLINDNVHIVIWDAYDAFQSIVVKTAGSSSLTEHVRNLSALSDSDVQAVAELVAMNNNFAQHDIYTFNGNTWIRLADNFLLTIVNSEYVTVAYYPNGDEMAEDDYADFTVFMRALTMS